MTGCRSGARSRRSASPLFGAVLLSWIAPPAVAVVAPSRRPARVRRRLGPLLPAGQLGADAHPGHLPHQVRRGCHARDAAGMARDGQFTLGSEPYGVFSGIFTGRRPPLAPGPPWAARRLRQARPHRRNLKENHMDAKRHQHPNRTWNAWPAGAPAQAGLVRPRTGVHRRQPAAGLAVRDERPPLGRVPGLRLGYRPGDPRRGGVPGSPAAPACTSAWCSRNAAAWRLQRDPW